MGCKPERQLRQLSRQTDFFLRNVMERTGRLTAGKQSGRLADAIFRNDEVVGSIPTSSTNLFNRLPSFFALVEHREDRLIAQFRKREEGKREDA
jgi:hypothetical protein